MSDYIDAAQFATTTQFEKAKFIADVLSGQFGRRVAPRRPFSMIERALGLVIAAYALWKAVIG